MGGIYISCGEYFGEDKSGSAIEGVLAALLEQLAPADRAPFQAALAPLFEGDIDEMGVELGAEAVAALEGPLRTYYEALGAKLGHPEPWEAPDLDAQGAQGVQGAVDAKWGAGDGWRYYCAHDLLQACEVHRESGGAPILIAYG